MMSFNELLQVGSVKEKQDRSRNKIGPFIQYMSFPARLCARTTTHAANVPYCSFSKIPSSWVGLGHDRAGPHLVGQIRSRVRDCDILHILSCAVVCALVRSDVRDTRPPC